jgi:hypothetical protein
MIKAHFGIRACGTRAASCGIALEMQISRQRGKYLKEQEFQGEERNFG